MGPGEGSSWLNLFLRHHGKKRQLSCHGSDVSDQIHANYRKSGPKEISKDVLNRPRTLSPSEMGGSIDPMCSRLAGQAAHISAEEVALLEHLLCFPDPSYCHC